MQRLELRIPPVILGVVTATLMGLTTRWAPSFAWSVPKSELIAAGLVSLGTLIACSGIISFRRARTTVNPTRPRAASSLVISGIYGYTRNPMYLDFALVLLAIGVWLSNALALVWVPVFVLYLDRFQIRPEERALESLFAESFPAYKARVRRWL
jgi:protein-S-isoprenylcysteine O-methyltransferase Ste14